MMMNRQPHSQKLNSWLVDGVIDERCLVLSLQDRMSADQTASEVVIA